ncbi:hypothetical protein QTO11_08420, partial [Vibrio campbellii]
MNKKIIYISALSAFFANGVYANNESGELVNLWEKAESTVLNNNELDIIKSYGEKTSKLNQKTYNTAGVRVPRMPNSSSGNNIVNYGFNILSQEPTNYNCLSENRTIEVPNFSKIVDGKVVINTTEINEFFEMNTSAG